MIIKKFVGKTEEEATAAAKKELGQNVVVMNVRPLRRSGFFSFLKAQKMEVTVALEDDPNRGSRRVQPQKETAAKPEGKGGSEAAFAVPKTSGIDLVAGLTVSNPMPSTGDLAQAAREGKIPPLKVGGASTAKHISPKTTEEKTDALGTAVSKVSAQAVTEEKTAEAEKNRTNAIEEKLDTLHSLLEQRIVGGQQPALHGEGVKDKRPQEEETDEGVKESKGLAKEEATETESEALSFIKLLYNTLLENEVDERYANDLTEEVGKLNGPNMSLDHALASVYQKMVLKFGKPETITPAKEGPKAEIFIGPTGVGKTTTIAKLASRLHIQEKKRVALLTVDTYRIAAAEQLRTYASILETPFRVIYSVEEMKQALEDFKDYDFIMIDTAGHSLHNEEQKENVAAFIEAVTSEVESETFLVLSATTKYRDLLDITETYAKMVSYRLIFTKMDETAATGNLYNIRLRTGAPMSYITNGQDVPDDIDEFHAQRIVKHLLGGH